MSRAEADRTGATRKKLNSPNRKVPAQSQMNTATLTHLKHAAKTGLAAVLAYYLAHFIRLPESYWAAISAIIVMYSDVSRTINASGQRLVGTAIGVSIGGLFVALFGEKLWAFGIAVTMTVFVCSLLGLADAARLAGVAVAIVMLIGHPVHPWIAPLHRFLEVSFGIVIAVLVSALIWPTRVAQNS
jgi:uncharacterized membrane protein YgaE (UPF0421/DUF939 family)